MVEPTKLENPFILSGYQGPDFFCDRQEETSTIFNRLKSANNITMYGRARIGKTALTHHVLNTLKLKNQYFQHLFINLFSIQSNQELVQKLCTNLLKKSGSDHKDWSPKLMDLVKSMNASIQFNAISELPKVNIALHSQRDMSVALEALFNYLEEDRTPWIIVLDEFHQFIEKGNIQLERILKQLINRYSKIRFVFIINEQPSLTSKISERKSNILNSAHLVKLDPMNSASYMPFIKEHFESGQKEIDAEAIQYIYSVMRAQTYGIQLLCNRLYNSFERVGIDEVRLCLKRILAEEQAVFSQITQLITPTQWKLLMAIASEDIVRQPLSSEFIKKYDLKSPSTVQTALKSLVKKSLVYVGEGYEVQDVVFAHWLKQIADS